MSVQDPTELTNLLTIDVEEYFHPNAMDGVVDPARWDTLPQRAEGTTHRLLDLLSEHGARATFFVLGWVAERSPDLVREIAARGHEVACHGYAHRLAYEMTPAQFRADVLRSKQLLEDCLGKPVPGFRAASFSLIESNLWALDVLIELGFAYDSSIFPVRHDLYGIPGFARFPVRLRRECGEIVEVPPSTVRWGGTNWPAAGGGYFRLLPYWLTRRAIRRIHRVDGEAALVYLHPWELDTEQPRLPASRRTRLRQYTNLHRVEGRIHQLLQEFRFAPIGETIRFASLPTVSDRTRGVPGAA